MRNVIEVDFVNKKNLLRDDVVTETVKLVTDTKVKQFIEKLKDVDGIDKVELKKIEKKYFEYESVLQDFLDNCDEEMMFYESVNKKFDRDQYMNDQFKFHNFRLFQIEDELNDLVDYVFNKSFHDKFNTYEVISFLSDRMNRELRELEMNNLLLRLHLNSNYRGNNIPDITTERERLSEIIRDKDEILVKLLTQIHTLTSEEMDFRRSS